VDVARPPRIEYPGAIYHVINRGNYRRDIFESKGAAQAFVAVLEEASARFGWELGAYVVMRNHYHLAIRTPDPNLSDGMHWMQTTFASRFNRFREVHGHLFQGRFKAIVLQNEGIWARVADYIHLNPLRAHAVEPGLLTEYPWSSLRRFTQGTRSQVLTAEPWLKTHGLTDGLRGWSAYVQSLLAQYDREQEIPESERENWSQGWAIGEVDWRLGLADHFKKAPDVGESPESVEPKELRELRWERRLRELLNAHGRTAGDLGMSRKGSSWKTEIANQHQRELGTSLVWLARELKIPRPATLRTALWRLRKR
jgi:putative transposase